MMKLIERNKTIRKIFYRVIQPPLRDIFPQWFTHPFTKYIKRTLGNELVGAEIGVFKGENAKNMLTVLDIKKLYLIDPYLPYNDNSYTAKQMSKEIEKSAEKRLTKYNNIEFIKKKSIDAVQDVPNDLDFIYIDGDHTYEGVKIDVELYYPKVKKGGIIGGDDFTLTHVGLMDAIIEYAKCHNLKLEGRYENWWIMKK